jgi:Flp pilus assembly protein TadB
MLSLAEIRKIFLGSLATLGVVAAGLVAVLVMLGVALAGLAGFFVAAVVRRVAPGRRRRASRGSPEVIEGEFRVERDDRAP